MQFESVFHVFLLFWAFVDVHIFPTFDAVSLPSLAFGSPNVHTSWLMIFRVGECCSSSRNSRNRAVRVRVPWVFAVLGIFGPNFELPMPASAANLAFRGPNFQTSWPIQFRVREYRQSRIKCENRALRVSFPLFVCCFGHVWPKFRAFEACIFAKPCVREPKRSHKLTYEVLSWEVLQFQCNVSKPCSSGECSMVFCCFGHCWPKFPTFDACIFGNPCFRGPQLSYKLARNISSQVTSPV